MATYDTAMPASMTNHTSDPLCPKFKKLKEEEKLGGKGRPLLGSKDVGKRVVGVIIAVIVIIYQVGP